MRSARRPPGTVWVASQTATTSYRHGLSSPPWADDMWRTTTGIVQVDAQARGRPRTAQHVWVGRDPWPDSGGRGGGGGSGQSRRQLYLPSSSPPLDDQPGISSSSCNLGFNHHSFPCAIASPRPPPRGTQPETRTLDSESHPHRPPCRPVLLRRTPARPGTPTPAATRSPRTSTSTTRYDSCWTGGAEAVLTCPEW